MRPRPERLRDYREYPILYVDDEPDNLRIFELAFRRDFAIRTAQNGEAGLEILNQEPVAIVLSDHRMPGMTGTEFLSQVAELDPKTIRLMVTAYGDAETLEDAINKGSIYRYIPKPWQPEDVRATLFRAIDAYAIEREREQLLHELTTLNRVSATLAQELELDRLLDLVLDTLVEDMGYDAAGLLFLDSEEKLSFDRMAPSGGLADEVLGALRIDARAAPDFMQRLLAGRSQTLAVGEALDYDTVIREWATEVAAEQILVTPLHGKHGVIGALTVDNRRGGTPFTTDDRTLLEGLSNQATIAIENARLVEDLRRSREQVRRADRLGTLGTLAAGLAHEINNPLVSIHTFLSMAPEKRDSQDPEFWGDYHDLACQEVERIQGLVETMRRLGRGHTAKALRENVQLAAVMDEVARLMRHELQLAGVELRVNCESELPEVLGSRDQLHQVMLNLVLNAVAVTPEDGTIELSAKKTSEGALLFEISDTGPGIPDGHLEQIFEPFFTTRDAEGGTGLGLMVCHRIVSDHGGSIEASNREGGGACFTVELPSVERAASELA